MRQHSLEADSIPKILESTFDSYFYFRQGFCFSPHGSQEEIARGNRARRARFVQSSCENTQQRSSFSLFFSHVLYLYAALPNTAAACLWSAGIMFTSYITTRTNTPSKCLRNKSGGTHSSGT